MRTRTLISLFISVFCCFSCVLAQDSIVLGDENYKLDLFRAVQGTIQLTREQRISSRYSLNIGVMGTYASTRGLAKPYLKAQDFVYVDATTNKIYSLENVEALGYGVNFQLRKYLSKYSTKALSGFYLAPELFYRRLYLSSLIETNIEVKRNLNLGYIGYALGYQKIWKDIVCIDTYVGGGFFLSQYTDEAHLTRFRNNYQVDFTGMYFNMGVLVGIVR
jgi:hypothetical protein